MKADSKNGIDNVRLVHWGRFIVAFLALLVAATHLNYIIPSGQSAPPASTGTSNTISNQPRTFSMPSFWSGALGLWLDIEVIAYTIIAVVWLLGLRTWYPAMVLFNAFNIVLYFLSGIIPIPGLTGMAFASHFRVFSSLNDAVLAISWIASLILGLALLKYDKGSELDALLVTHKG